MSSNPYIDRWGKNGKLAGGLATMEHNNGATMEQQWSNNGATMEQQWKWACGQNNQTNKKGRKASLGNETRKSRQAIIRASCTCSWSPSFLVDFYFYFYCGSFWSSLDFWNEICCVAFVDYESESGFWI
jgi:hypothetical protein